MLATKNCSHADSPPARRSTLAEFVSRHGGWRFGFALIAIVILGVLPLGRLEALTIRRDSQLSEDDSFDFQNSRAQAVLIGTIMRIETVVERGDGGDRVHQIAYVRPDEWIRPQGKSTAILAIESSYSHVGRVLPMRDGQLAGPVRALLFLRAIPQGNTNHLPGVRWVFPVVEVDGLSGIKLLGQQVDVDRARDAVSRSSVRLTPRRMASRADLVISAQRLPGDRICPPPAKRNVCVPYRVDDVLAGTVEVSEITVYADPPRALPEGKAVLFLSRMPSGNYQVLHTGHGAFALEGARISALGISVAELRQVVLAARREGRDRQ
jgi:hypothetical protein